MIMNFILSVIFVDRFLNLFEYLFLNSIEFKTFMLVRTSIANIPRIDCTVIDVIVPNKDNPNWVFTCIYSVLLLR